MPHSSSSVTYTVPERRSIVAGVTMRMVECGTTAEDKGVGVERAASRTGGGGMKVWIVFRTGYWQGMGWRKVETVAATEEKARQLASDLANNQWFDSDKFGIAWEGYEVQP